MIEYLLMVVVGVTLISALAMALFRPLGAYIEALNQRYIQCLLETGELPALKSGQQMICASEVPQFGDINSSGGMSGGGGLNPNENAGQGGSNTSGSGSDSSQDTASSGGSPPNRKSSVIRNGMRSPGGAQPEINSSKSTIIPVETFEAGNGYMNLSSPAAQARARARKSRQIAIDSLTEFERKKLERESKKVSTIPTDGESFTQTKKKKVTVKPPPPREIAEAAESGLDFSFYFRIFFIIIIILFLIILLGGQAMQISKNWE